MLCLSCSACSSGVLATPRGEADRTPDCQQQKVHELLRVADAQLRRRHLSPPPHPLRKEVCEASSAEEMYGPRVRVLVTRIAQEHSDCHWA